MKNILVISAHPDDEILGCGGTIAKHSHNGDTINQVFVSDGESSRNLSKEKLKSLVNKRKKIAMEAAKIIGVSKSHFLNLRDNQLDQVSLLKITKLLEAIVNKLSPDVIYTHSENDLNIDHQIVHRAVMTACRPLPGQTVKEIYSFEIISSTEWGLADKHNAFYPNFFNDITQFVDKKIEALKLYKDELRPYPHPRSIKGITTLANYRGMSAGFEYAEAFKIKRILSSG